MPTRSGLPGKRRIPCLLTDAFFHTGTNGHARQHSQRKAQPQVFRPIQRGGQRHSQPHSKAHALPAVILPGFLLFLLPAAANSQHRHCHAQNRPGKRCTYKFQDRVHFNPSSFVRPVPLQDPRCWPGPMHPETASALLCGTNARRPPLRLGPRRCAGQRLPPFRGA